MLASSSANRLGGTRRIATTFSTIPRCTPYRRTGQVAPAPDRRDLTGPNYKERKESKENTKQCNPTLGEISEYAREIGLAVDDAENFFDYYTANGWKVGRQAMVDWRAALRNWMRNARRFSAAPDSSSPPLVDGSQLLR